MDNFRGGNQGNRDRDRDIDDRDRDDRDRDDRDRDDRDRDDRDRDPIIRVQNALIENISRDNRMGYVRISYGVPGERNMIRRQIVVLIVDRDTIIRNQFGQRVSLGDLEEGMYIDAEFSSAMTRSLPPQARAFRITVRNGRGRDSSSVKLGMIINVDLNNRFFVTGTPSNLRNQMRFIVSSSTVILDRRGNRIDLRNLRPGMMVRVEHADFQTASIPPQTTAFRVQVL